MVQASARVMDAAEPKIRWSSPACPAPPARRATESRQMPRPKDALDTAAVAVSAVSRVRRVSQPIAATAREPLMPAPRRRISMERGALPSAASAPRTRNAAATPARDAWAKASATRDSLRSMLKTPTVPAATPSRIAAQSTTFVLKPPPKERARSHSATNSPMSVRPVRLRPRPLRRRCARWRGPRRPDPGL